MKHTFRLIWKTVLWTLLAFGVFLAISRVWRYVIWNIADYFSISYSGLESVLFWGLVAGISLLPRLNFPITLRRSAIIRAPLEKVWDELPPRARDDYFPAGSSGSQQIRMMTNASPFTLTRTCFLKVRTNQLSPKSKFGKAYRNPIWIIAITLMKTLRTN